MTFLLTFRNLGNFISVQMETAVGVYPLCIYTWHRCAPSTEGVHPMLSYIYLLGVGFCCFLSLTLWSIPRYLKGKDEAKGNKIPTPSFYNSNPVSNNLLCLGNRWSIFIGLGDTDMAKKIDLEALHQQINELQIDKDLNRGKLHSLSEKFTIFEHEGNIETIPRIELALIIIGGHPYLSS